MTMQDTYTMLFFTDGWALYNQVIFGLVFVFILFVAIEVYCATHDDDDA